MCLQCDVEAAPIGILGNWYLAQGIKDHPLWPQDYWGLGRENDPDIVFQITPWKDPLMNFSDDDLDDLFPKFGPKTEEAIKLAELADKWLEDFSVFKRNFKLEPEVGFELGKACCKNGWVSSEESLLYWLFNYLADYTSSK